MDSYTYTRELEEYGCATLRKGTDEEDEARIVFLENMVIASAYQNKGFGTRLLNAILDDAYEFEYKKVIVHARPLVDDSRQDDLIRFYKMNGFIKSTNYHSSLGVMMEVDL